MRLPDWVRHLPHPGYGRYGGRKRRCESAKSEMCPIPLDGLDKLFMRHDIDMRIANTVYSNYKRRHLQKQADERLALGLRNLDTKYLSYQGRIYRVLAMFVFRV